MSHTLDDQLTVFGLGHIPIDDLDIRCNDTLTLHDGMPAVKLILVFEEAYSPTTTLCQTHVNVNGTGFYLGVLTLDFPHMAKKCDIGDDCHCMKEVFRLKYNGRTHRYCNNLGSNHLETNVLTHSLTVERWLDHYPKEYTLLVFRYALLCYKYIIDVDSSDMWRCPYTSRCIEETLICEEPYKFCGDDSNLCQRKNGTGTGTVSTQTGSNASLTAGLVVSAVILVMLGALCYVCVAKNNVCRIKRLFRSSSQSERREVRSEARRIFTVQFTSRGVSSNHEEDLGTVNIAFSEAPPDYDSVVADDQRRSDAVTSADKDMTDMLPGYDAVMSNALAYKVKSTTEQYGNSGN